MPPVWLVMLMAVDAPVFRLLVAPENVKLLELSSSTMPVPLVPMGQVTGERHGSGGMILDVDDRCPVCGDRAGVTDGGRAAGAGAAGAVPDQEAGGGRTADRAAAGGKGAGSPVPLTAVPS